MSFIVLSASDIERLLPMRECIDLMACAFEDLRRGDLNQPLRVYYAPPAVRGGTMWMPSYRSKPTPMFGTKLLFVLQDNPSRGLDSHQGQVILADGQTGQLRALLDASAVTAIRTAAVSALATRLLARTSASVLAIIGTGVQARRHAESIPLVRPVSRIVVAGRTFEQTAAFVKDIATASACPIDAAQDAEAAIQAADIVVTATSSPSPVLERGWLRPGAHVNAVGASRPAQWEIDPRIFQDAVAFTDRRDSLVAEAGDFQQASSHGFVAEGSVGELSELLAGTRPGRTSDDQITLFRSLGLGIEDLAAAEHVVAKALDQRVGVIVDVD